MARAVVLVDGGYFDYVNSYCRDVHGSKVDIQAFGEEIADHFGVDLLRLKYYHSLPYSDINRELTPEEQKENERTQSFFDTVDDLTNCEHVKAGRVQESQEHCPKCNQTFRDRNQKGTDVQIAVDLAKMAFNQHSPGYFILVAGDEDLIHGVRVAKDTHSNVYLGYAYDQSHQLFSAQLLRQECDDKVNIVDGFLESVTL
jgi:uncharacterized LabA/DUF88 family protein